jgi:hypothetical protein
VDSLAKSKAQEDYYDAVHYRRLNNTATTLCGLKLKGPSVDGEVTCLSCRQFAAGDF